MYTSNRLLAEPREVTLPLETDLSRLQLLEGRVQRVNYAKREWTLISSCQIWHFEASPDCRFLFDDQPTVLRCFHPLDAVKVFFDEDGDRLVARVGGLGETAGVTEDFSPSSASTIAN